MNCYFCNTPKSIGRNGSALDSCKSCENKYGLLGVYTTVDDDNKLMYTHVFIASPEYKVIDMPQSRAIVGLRGSTIEIGYKYHIRWHWQDNHTMIIAQANSHYKELIRLEGFPITIENAKQKLKTYLVFS